MINQRERQEKITRMKLQTAKVLWQEGRKDATFLLVESIDDPRGDTLREQMGFSDDYEVGVAQGSRGFSRVHIGSAIVISAVLFFFLGFLFRPDSNNIPVLETTLNDNQVISTLVAPTPAPGETLSQPLIALTVTVGTTHCQCCRDATERYSGEHRAIQHGTLRSSNCHRKCTRNTGSNSELGLSKMRQYSLFNIYIYNCCEMHVSLLYHLAD